MSDSQEFEWFEPSESSGWLDGKPLESPGWLDGKCFTWTVIGIVALAFIFFAFLVFIVLRFCGCSAQRKRRCRPTPVWEKSHMYANDYETTSNNAPNENMAASSDEKYRGTPSATPLSIPSNHAIARRPVGVIQGRASASSENIAGHASSTNRVGHDSSAKRAGHLGVVHASSASESGEHSASPSPLSAGMGATGKDVGITPTSSVGAHGHSTGGSDAGSFPVDGSDVVSEGKSALGDSPSDGASPVVDGANSTMGGDVAIMDSKTLSVPSPVSPALTPQSKGHGRSPRSSLRSPRSSLRSPRTSLRSPRTPMSLRGTIQESNLTGRSNGSSGASISPSQRIHRTLMNRRKQVATVNASSSRRNSTTGHTFSAQ